MINAGVQWHSKSSLPTGPQTSGHLPRRNRLYGVEIFPADEQWTTDNANLVAFDPVTGARTEVLNGFASLPNELIVGPDGALYTSNWGISFAADGGDGQVLRIVP